VAVLVIDRRLRAAKQRERGHAAQAGAVLFASTSLPVVNAVDAGPLRRQIAPLVAHMATLDEAMQASLDKDRRDYARASQLMRWIVVARGILDRWILRDRVRHHRHERDRLTQELGLLAVDGAHPDLAAALPDSLRESFARGRTAADAAQRERAALLAPYQGSLLPAWMAEAVKDTRPLMHHILEQFTRRLFLRVPAIGALLAGWWLVHTYTDSTFESIQHNLGLGGRAHMSPGLLKFLRFFVPLLAAAVCAYAVNIIAVMVQRKYALPAEK
jgi:hypothetical protein